MAHVETTTGSIIPITQKLLMDNYLAKFIISGFIGLIGLIFNGNEIIIFLIFLLYSIDFLTGVIRAVINNNFKSDKFFIGCTKLLIYGIYMVIGVTVDRIIGGHYFLWFVFSFIAITDSISILENLEDLGYTTPIGLKEKLKTILKSFSKKDVKPK